MPASANLNSLNLNPVSWITHASHSIGKPHRDSLE